MSIIYHHPAITDDIYRHTMTLHALKDIEIHSLMVGFGWNCPCLVWIPHYNICIRPFCNATLCKKKIRRLLKMFPIFFLYTMQNPKTYVQWSVYMIQINDQCHHLWKHAVKTFLWNKINNIFFCCYPGIYILS